MSYEILGFLIGQRLRPMLKATDAPDTPDVPTTADYYLYGTPIPAPAEGKAFYNGRELPILPTDNYKNDFVNWYIGEYTNGVVVAFLCDTANIEWYKDARFFCTSYTTYYKYYLDTNTNSWVYQSYDSNGGNSTLGYDTTYKDCTFIWSNRAITDRTNSGVFYEGSEPVYTQFGGNVALADGEGYVLYKGAVLPKLPNDLKYANTYIFKGENSYVMYNLNASFYIKDHLDPYGRYYMHADAGGAYAYYSIVNGAWVWADGGSSGYVLSNSVLSDEFDFLWSSIDVPNRYNSTTYLSASDPVPLVSNEPVAAVYNGVKLPPLPEWDETIYPYAFIETAFGSSLEVMSSYSTSTTNGGYINTPPHWLQSNLRVGNVWPDFTEINSDSGAANHHSVIIWTNFDVTISSSVSFTASDPIPIYEQKE